MYSIIISAGLEMPSGTHPAQVGGAVAAAQRRLTLYSHGVHNGTPGMTAANTAHTEAGRPLQAFWVGLEEIYAAYNAEGALHLANQEYRQTLFGIDDVQLCEASTLEAPAYSVVGSPLGTLWQHVALMRTPGYVGVS